MAKFSLYSELYTLRVNVKEIFVYAQVDIPVELPMSEHASSQIKFNANVLIQ